MRFFYLLFLVLLTSQLWSQKSFCFDNQKQKLINSRISYGHKYIKRFKKIENINVQYVLQKDTHNLYWINCFDLGFKSPKKQIEEMKNKVALTKGKENSYPEQRLGNFLKVYKISCAEVDNIIAAVREQIAQGKLKDSYDLNKNFLENEYDISAVNYRISWNSSDKKGNIYNLNIIIEAQFLKP